MFTRFLLISIIIALYIGTELFLLEKLEKDLEEICIQHRWKQQKKEYLLRRWK